MLPEHIAVKVGESCPSGTRGFVSESRIEVFEVMREFVALVAAQAAYMTTLKLGRRMLVGEPIAAEVAVFEVVDAHCRKAKGAHEALKAGIAAEGLAANWPALNMFFVRRRLT